MTDARLKEKIVERIEDDGATTGWRTTEVEQLYRRIITGRRHAKDDKDNEWYGCHAPSGLMERLVEELVAEKRIKCVTEDQQRPDYCWLVLPGYVYRCPSGYIAVPKKDCPLFGLW